MKFSIKKLKQAKWKKKTRLVQHDYEEVDNQIINIPEISDASVISEEIVDVKEEKKEAVKIKPNKKKIK